MRQGLNVLGADAAAVHEVPAAVLVRREVK